MTHTEQVWVGEPPRLITVRYPQEYVDGRASFTSGANCPDDYTEEQQAHWYDGYWGDNELEYEVKE